ncbi:P-type ATPase, subfamily IIB, partial [Kipferlia bialata]
VGTGAAVFTILALIVQWIFSFGDDRTFEAAAFLDWIDYMILGITIIVVAVPEGLPLAVTISLAYSVGKMMEDKNLVRKLAACETMGGATNICSDKTGTLTENRMTVVKLLAGGSIHEEAPTERQPNGLSACLSDAIVLGGVLNSNARLTPAKEGSDMPEVVGSKTEGALLILAHRLGYGIQAVKDTLKVGDVENGAVSADYDFSSDRKRMSRCVNLAKANFEGVIRTEVTAGETGERLYCKGASEIVLGRCSSQLESDGSVAELNEESRTLITDTIDSFARQSLRTIVLAYRDIPSSIVDGTSADNTPLMADADVVESDLVFVCLVGIKDPVRAAVPDAIRQCQRAGITVRMITGDNIVTGVAIAKECGILPADADMNLCCIEGPRFRELSDAQVDEILPTLRVMARSSPTDKYRLVKRLRHHGEVVGVTGDGSNDGPALKEADVGLSMGIAGTEVAKEASDIVILDDNFASIVRAVVWGRSVLANIRKFLQFQLTVNVVALIITFIGAVTDGESPLNAVQLLYVNLIMDSLGALALATEEPNDEILQNKPVGRNIPLLTPCMLRNIAVQSLYQLAVLLVLLYLGTDLFGLVEPAATDYEAYEEYSWHLHTIVYNAFIFCQIANEFNTRRIGNEQDIFAGILRAHLFIAVIVFSVAMQWVIVTFGGVLTKTVPLNATEWFYTVLIGVASIPIGFIVKLFVKLPREFEDPTLKTKAKQSAVAAEEMV